MKKSLLYFIKLSLICTFVIFASFKSYAEDEESISQALQTLQEDIKTLEKAVYSQRSQYNIYQFKLIK